MRKEVYNILESIIYENKHAHLALREKTFSPQEQDFVTALVYTVLDHYLYLDYQVKAYVDDRLAKEVYLVLLMGAAQHYYFDSVPDYAIVNESVELVKNIGKESFHGLVNAVMKKIVENPPRKVKGSSLEQASIEFSFPLWILKLLKAQYGEEFALGYAAYCQEKKPYYVRLNPSRNHDHLLKHLDGVQAKPSIFKTDYLQNGDVMIQDINSQKVVSYLQLEKGHSVLDCCCGPGTKTSQIADILEDTGMILGVELESVRVEETKNLLQNWGVKSPYQILESDILDFKTNARFDRILIDAPCSGLGVLSHKPDLRYRIKPEELDDLETLQADILEHTSQFLKDDGLMVYATCTLNRKENEKQVEHFLSKHPEFKLLSEQTLHPMETQGDGFYIAQLAKRK